MSHPFHYHIPGQGIDSFAPGQKFGQTQLDSVGLGYLFELLKSGATMLEAKVEGKSGLLFTPNLGGQPAQVTSYQAETQQWITSGKVMIGWERNAPPTAEVLAKARPIPGYPLSAAGTAWTIPLARSPRGHSMLPQDFIWDENGEPVPTRRADSDWMWDLSAEVWDYWHTERDQELGGEIWLAKTALRILQVNYFIGPVELNAFRAMGKPVIDQLNAAAISLAFIDNDLPKLIAESKKNEAD